MRYLGPVLIAIAGLCFSGCSKSATRAEIDPRPEIQRFSGLILPSNWVCETTELDGLFVVRIKAPPKEMEEFCATNKFEMKAARKADRFLEANESDNIFRKAEAADNWEMRVNAAEGRAAFLRSGPDNSGE